MHHHVARGEQVAARRRRGRGRRARRPRPPPLSRVATTSSKRSPSSWRRRSKQSLRTTSRASRAAALDRRVGRTNTATSHPGTQRTSRSTRAVPRNPVAPVTRMRLPDRASAMPGRPGSPTVVGVVTSATISVYHMVGGRGKKAERRDGPPRGRHRRPHPRRRPGLVRVPGLRGDVPRRPGRGPRRAQAVDPLLVPVQRGPARSADRPLGRGAGERPRGLPGHARDRGGAGGGGGAVGLPAGVATPRAPRPAARGGSTGAARPPPG